MSDERNDRAYDGGGLMTEEQRAQYERDRCWIQPSAEPTTAANAHGDCEHQPCQLGWGHDGPHIRTGANTEDEKAVGWSSYREELFASWERRQAGVETPTTGANTDLSGRSHLHVGGDDGHKQGKSGRESSVRTSAQREDMQVRKDNPGERLPDALQGLPSASGNASGHRAEQAEAVAEPTTGANTGPTVDMDKVRWILEHGGTPMPPPPLVHDHSSFGDGCNATVKWPSQQPATGANAEPDAFSTDALTPEEVAEELAGHEEAAANLRARVLKIVAAADPRNECRAAVERICDVRDKWMRIAGERAATIARLASRIVETATNTETCTEDRSDGLGDYFACGTPMPCREHEHADPHAECRATIAKLNEEIADRIYRERWAEELDKKVRKLGLGPESPHAECLRMMDDLKMAGDTLTAQNAECLATIVKLEADVERIIAINEKQAAIGERLRGDYHRLERKHAECRAEVARISGAADCYRTAAELLTEQIARLNERIAFLEGCPLVGCAITGSHDHNDGGPAKISKEGPR